MHTPTHTHTDLNVIVGMHTHTPSQVEKKIIVGTFYKNAFLGMKTQTRGSLKIFFIKVDFFLSSGPIYSLIWSFNKFGSN